MCCTFISFTRRSVDLCLFDKQALPTSPKMCRGFLLYIKYITILYICVCVSARVYLSKFKVAVSESCSHRSTGALSYSVSRQRNVDESQRPRAKLIVHKKNLKLRSIERMLQMQFSMGRKFPLWRFKQIQRKAC